MYYDFETIDQTIVDFKDKVEKIKSAEDAITVLLDMRDFYEELSNLEKSAKKLFTRLKSEIVPEIFESKDFKSITHKGYRFTVSQTMRASILGGKKEEAFEWLRGMDLGDLITETVNAQTLSSAAREMLDQGVDLDPDLFNTYYQNNTSITKVK